MPNRSSLAELLGLELHLLLGGPKLLQDNYIRLAGNRQPEVAECRNVGHYNLQIAMKGLVKPVPHPPAECPNCNCLRLHAVEKHFDRTKLEESMKNGRFTNRDLSIKIGSLTKRTKREESMKIGRFTNRDLSMKIGSLIMPAPPQPHQPCQEQEDQEDA